LPREHYQGDAVVHWKFSLAKHPREWPFNGAILPGYPTLHPLQEDFWRKFWKLHAQAREPDAGNMLRPPIG
jgi:hypothetical protein